MKKQEDNYKSKQNEDRMDNEALETLKDEYDTEDKIFVIGGGDPNLSPDAGKPLR